MSDKEWNDYLLSLSTGVSLPSHGGQTGAYHHKLHNPPPRPSKVRNKPKPAPVTPSYAGVGAGTLGSGSSLTKGFGVILFYAALAYIGYLFYQGWFTEARISTFGAWVRNSLYFGVLPLCGLAVITTSWIFSSRTSRSAARWLAIHVFFLVPVLFGFFYLLEWLRKALELPLFDLLSFNLASAIILALITVPATITGTVLAALLHEKFGTQARPWQLFLFFGARRRAKVRNELSVLLRDGNGERLTPNVWRNSYLAGVLYSFIYWRISAYFRGINNDRLQAIALSEFRRAARASGVSEELVPPDQDRAAKNHGALLAATLRSADKHVRSPRFQEAYAREIGVHIEAARKEIPLHSKAAAYQNAILSKYWRGYLK